MGEDGGGEKASSSTHLVSISCASHRMQADRWFVLAALTAIYATNIANRYLLSTLMEPIKKAFALTDAASGVLTGVPIALLFVAAGIPLGLLSDRSNRRKVIFWCTATFSAMTVLCGAASSVITLFVARMGVGIGEAGTTPASLSILSDKFAPSKRAVAMTIFTLGLSIGSAYGSVVGGWLSDQYGWRAALVLLGLLGFMCAVLLVWIREPVRGAADPGTPTSASAMGLRQALRFIREQRSLFHAIVAGTVVTLWGWGLLWWTPAFLMRSHHMSTGQAGLTLGAIHAIGGTTAMLLTTGVMQWFSRRDPRYQTRFLGWSVLVTTIPSIIAYWTDSLLFAEIMMWLFIPVIYLCIGPLFALVNNLSLPTMRALAVALLVFASNFANFAIAPPGVGLASDWLQHHLANPQNSLRYVLIVLGFTGFWAAAHFFMAGRDLHQNLRRAGTEAVAPSDG